MSYDVYDTNAGWRRIILCALLLLAACSYVVGGRNPFVVAPLPERACNGTWTADSAEVCRDTVTR